MPNFSKVALMKNIVEPFNEGKSFSLVGDAKEKTYTINPSTVGLIQVFSSKVPYCKLVLPNGKNPINEKKGYYVLEMFAKHKVKGIHNCTHDFITPSEKTNIGKVLKTILLMYTNNKTKIFIVHGRDKAPALELKDYLKDSLHLDAVIFDDVKRSKTSITIIEMLEEIMNNAAYAFITATPDDLGCLGKEITESKECLIGKRSISGDKVAEILSKFKTRARQNVVFEQGLFIGALGRDKVCCLLNVDVKDKPTDIDGILYEPFKDSVKETFPQITEKLKDPKVGLIKP